MSGGGSGTDVPANPSPRRSPAAPTEELPAIGASPTVRPEEE